MNISDGGVVLARMGRAVADLCVLADSSGVGLYSGNNVFVPQ